MIVTRSRLHAVCYELAVRAYLKELCEPFKALVAFTGTVKDPDTGKEYTETGMNGVTDTKTEIEFEARTTCGETHVQERIYVQENSSNIAGIVCRRCRYLRMYDRHGVPKSGGPVSNSGELGE